MRERESWNEFAGRLSPKEHARLVVALGTALQQNRKASQAALENGQVEQVKEHVETAISFLSDVLRILEGS